MGTDCTTLVELQITDRWVPALVPVWTNPLYDLASENPLLHDQVTHFPIMKRDYPLFSLLADVRNRTGRGTQELRHIRIPDSDRTVDWIYDTDDGGHDPLIPIAMPRGVPVDATKAWRDLTKGEMFHDSTHFTLDELLAAPWDQRVYSDGIISEEAYLEWRDKNVTPDFVARGAGGDGTAIVNAVDYEAGKRGEKSTYVNNRWANGTIREHSAWFFRHLEMMQMLAPDDDPTRVRMLATFDS